MHKYHLSTSKNAQPSLNTVPKSVSGDGEEHFSINLIQSAYLLRNGGVGHQMTHLKDFVYLFLERGEGREKDRERSINVREKH